MDNLESIIYYTKVTTSSIGLICTISAMDDDIDGCYIVTSSNKLLKQCTLSMVVDFDFEAKTATYDKTKTIVLKNRTKNGQKYWDCVNYVPKNGYNFFRCPGGNVVSWGRITGFASKYELRHMIPGYIHQSDAGYANIQT